MEVKWDVSGNQTADTQQINDSILRRKEPQQLIYGQQRRILNVEDGLRVEGCAILCTVHTVGIDEGQLAAPGNASQRFSWLI